MSSWKPKINRKQAQEIKDRGIELLPVPIGDYIALMELAFGPLQIKTERGVAMFVHTSPRKIRITDKDLSFEEDPVTGSWSGYHKGIFMAYYTTHELFNYIAAHRLTIVHMG